MPGVPESCELRANGLDLALTLESGQFFRATVRGEAYQVVHREQVFEVRQEGNRLIARGTDAATLGRFLGLDSGATEARARLARVPALRPALRVTEGLAILRQDLWECLVAFHCSTVSNIGRITRQVEGLARAFGRPIGEGDLRGWAFPRPGAIRPGPALGAIRLGFRERRLLALQEAVDETWLARLAALPVEEQRGLLMSLPGVGPKVADCVLLFALGRSGAFPIDVWIGRAVRGMAPPGARSYDRIRAWAAQAFGDDAGLAQQALFLWARGGGKGRGLRQAPRRTSRIRSAARPSP